MKNRSLMEKLSDDEFQKIVLDSFSITEATKKCGYKTYKSGSGRHSVIQRIKSNGIDTSHFRSTGRQFEKPPHNKIADYSAVLKRNSTANRITVRDIILREGLIEYKCSECGNVGIWNGKPLSLQLHHEDGDTMNNELENLTFLCPNCHAQTDNYSYKNAKRAEKKIFYCTECGKKISNYTRTGKCRECAAKTQIISMPSMDELICVIKDIKFKKYICFHYGVSDKTLDKWLISYGLPTHISELHKYLSS